MTMSQRLRENIKKHDPTFNIQVWTSLNLIDGTCVFSHVFKHWFFDCKLMYGHLLIFILKNLNFVLFAFEDFFSLEGPFCLLVCFAEGGGENHFLILQFFDAFILEWNNPFIWFLKLLIVKIHLGSRH